MGYLVGGAELVPIVIRVSAALNHPLYLDIDDDVVQTWAPHVAGVVIDRTFWLLLFTCVPILPLSLFRDLGALRFTSIFAIACIAFLTCAAVFKYYEFRHAGLAPTISYQLSHLPLFNWSMNHVGGELYAR